ncbi:Mrp/NBP35 family ATP-binding protein [Inmirania thermothiophila]|uniref:Iron-sulfur cluster carrier protein n=1 Tax=Inmirania thermothiophila TaxID=1750597 RepID=A0A3N1XZG8_9GAMM|nr:Mrp/NBP35 family ATP-binding protein [Inmirania thermothiophila]ROR31969.1 ATP-binding protein involved in chromosome partitioning [Inmirania thermothiophila]
MSVEDAARKLGLEQRVLAALTAVTVGVDGSDVVTSGQVYDVVATGGAVRILIDPDKVPEPLQEELAQVIAPYVESLPGVERVVVKPRPRPVAQRERIPGIAHVVGVHSGKGGVGKSTVVVNLAVALAQRGLRVGLLDADVYGPSCPTLLGLSGRAEEDPEQGRIEPKVGHGVKVMSLGFLLPEGQALIWRGSLVDEGLPQLFEHVAWGELDVLLIDLPPGTSDVHIAVARYVRLAGIVTVTAPGQVSVDDVRRGMEMFADMAVPCLGLVENMSGVACRGCGHVAAVFGAGGAHELAEQTGLPLLAEIPFEPEVSELCDGGRPVVTAAPGSRTAEGIERIAAALVERLGLGARVEASA